MNNNLYKHTEGVALLCHYLAKAAIPYDSRFAKDMYIIGMLHDFAKDVDFFPGAEYSTRGEAALKQLHFPYAETIGNHGNPTEIKTIEALILNTADMSVMPNGTVVSFEERLNDIARRYGDNSEEYINSCKVIDVIKEKLFDRNFSYLNLPIKNPLQITVPANIRDESGKIVGAESLIIDVPVINFLPDENITVANHKNKVIKIPISIIRQFSSTRGLTFMRGYKNLLKDIQNFGIENLERKVM